MSYNKENTLITSLLHAWPNSILKLTHPVFFGLRILGNVSPVNQTCHNGTQMTPYVP
jgi:hypothetical protein